MGQARTWTEEDKFYLEEKWGSTPIPQLALDLDRTENAVIQKAYRMGLGPFLDSGNYITLNQLMKAIGIEKGVDSYKKISWVKNRDFPVRRKKIRTDYFYTISIDAFWKWAEKNLDILDFSKFEAGTLGKEPEWAKQKRKHDIERNRKYIKTPWTKTEDEQLRYLLKKQKYTWHELSQKLRRTTGAIQVRITELGIKDRPVNADKHVRWTDREKEMVTELILSGYGYELMAEKIGKSNKALRGYVGRTYETERLDKVRAILKTKK